MGLAEPSAGWLIGPRRYGRSLLSPDCAREIGPPTSLSAGRQRTGHGRTMKSAVRRGASGLLLCILAAGGPIAAPAAASKVYTIANYPVEATAKDAVAAKEKALAEGQQA